MNRFFEDMERTSSLNEWLLTTAIFVAVNLLSYSQLY